MTLRVDANRLRRDLEQLSAIGRNESGGITRTSFSAADQQARSWYADRCTEAGLDLRVDGLGNLVAGLPAADGALSPVWSGSHIDTVPNGGAFDGALGSIAALECVRRLSEAGVELARPVQAVVFSDEEGNYGHLFGSGGLASGYTAEQLDAMTGRDGERLVTALADCNLDPAQATKTRIATGAIHAFVELHIEQGPRLESSGTDIGVVTGIVCLGGASVEFCGRADHAGGTPMDARKDALLGAADLLTRLPAAAVAVGREAVATCGNLRVTPGADNVVPGGAVLRLDFRHPTRDGVAELDAAIRSAAEVAAQARGLQVEYRPDTVVEPVTLDVMATTAIRDAADRVGLSHTPIASAAGHDSQNIALIAPTGMIFVPSKGGRSHCPEEDTDWSDVEKGANVLLETLIALAST